MSVRSIIWRIQSRAKRISAPESELMDAIRGSGTMAFGKRVFLHGSRFYEVESLLCSAVPGTLETALVEFRRVSGDGAPPRQRLLNAGSGPAGIERLLEWMGFDVTNLDLDIAKPDPRNVKYDLNAPGQLPFGEGEFNVVFVQEVIEHLENPWDLFRKVKRVLSDDGMLVLSTPNVQSRVSRRTFKRHGWFRWFGPECRSYHINPLFFWEIELIAERTGFDVVTVKGNGDFFLAPQECRIERILDRNEGLVFFLHKKRKTV